MTRATLRALLQVFSPNNIVDFQVAAPIQLIFCCIFGGWRVRIVFPTIDYVAILAISLVCNRILGFLLSQCALCFSSTTLRPFYL